MATTFSFVSQRGEKEGKLKNKHTPKQDEYKEQWSFPGVLAHTHHQCIGIVQIGRGGGDVPILTVYPSKHERFSRPPASGDPETNSTFKRSGFL